MVIKTNKLIVLHERLFSWGRLTKPRASKESNKLLLLIELLEEDDIYVKYIKIENLFSISQYF